MLFETDDQRADRLLTMGLNLVSAVRDDDPNAYVRPLAHLDHGELVHLAVLLAACVPEDRSRSELLAWWNDPAPATVPDVGALLAERFGLAPGSVVR